MPDRRVLLVTHASRRDAQELAAAVATRLLASGIGVCAPQSDLDGTPPTADVKIRASWTPIDRGMDAHLRAWCTLLASTAGLPPPGASGKALTM